VAKECSPGRPVGRRKRKKYFLIPKVMSKIADAITRKRGDYHGLAHVPKAKETADKNIRLISNQKEVLGEGKKGKRGYARVSKLQSVKLLRRKKGHKGRKKGGKVG